jgi:hypothetical protein
MLLLCCLVIMHVAPSGQTARPLRQDGSEGPAAWRCGSDRAEINAHHPEQLLRQCAACDGLHNPPAGSRQPILRRDIARCYPACVDGLSAT